MATLEEGLERIHEAGIGACITWLWDGGVDVRLLAQDGKLVDETQVRAIDEVLPWLRKASHKHFPNATYEPGRHTTIGNLRAELQKIYDSEINIEISWIENGPIAVKLGNEFYGFDAEARSAICTRSCRGCRTRFTSTTRNRSTTWSGSAEHGRRSGLARGTTP